MSLGSRRDEGTYYCVSKNEMGITRANIQVYSKYTKSIEERNDVIQVAKIL